MDPVLPRRGARSSEAPEPTRESARESAREVTRQEKRGRIVDAAIAVFAEKGFHKARISEIARKAGVADGTIYLYFDNKDELLLTIFEEKMEQLLSELRAYLAGFNTPIARIQAFARFHFEQLRTYPDLARVLQVELRQSTRFTSAYRPQRLWDYLDAFEELIHQGQEQGVLRQETDAFIVKWAFFGALDELSVQWVLSRKRDRFNLDQAAEEVVSVFLRGMAIPTGS